MKYSRILYLTTRRLHSKSRARIPIIAVACLACAIMCLREAAVALPGPQPGGDGVPRLERQGSVVREWQQLPGPYGASVHSMIPTAWGAWYAGSDGGVYRSDDDGTSWSPLSPLPLRFNRFSALIPMSPEVILAGTDRGSFVTRDGGNSWVALPRGITDVALDSSGVLCALIDGSVHVSHDSGLTWSGPTLRSSGVFVDLAYQLYAPTRGMMLALSRATLYRSTDGGRTWDSLFVPFSTRDGYDAGGLFGDHVNLCIAILPSNADLIWVYVSRDLGRTWNELFLPVGPDGLVTACDARGESFALVERRMESCSAVLHTSGDGGRTWSGCTVPDFSVIYARIRPDGDVFVGTWECLSRVNPRTNRVVDAGKGLVTPVVRALVALSDSILIAGTHSQLLRSTDAGTTWSTVLRTPGCRMSGEHLVRLGDGSVLIAGTDESLVPMLMRSTDSGRTWHSRYLPKWDYLPRILTSDGSTRILAAYDDGDLRLSVDTGASWTRVTAPLRYTRIQAAAVDANGRIFVCQQDVLRHTDDQINWTTSVEGVPASFEVIDLLHDGTGRMIANTESDGVFQSTDHGVHWAAMHSGLSDVSLDAVLFDSRGTLYAMDSEITYRLDTVAARWRIIARRAVGIAVRSFASAPSGRLFQGTQYFGVWMLEPPIDEPRISVVGFTLLPGYPNPATGPSLVTFEIDTWATVDITIHDMLGRKVYRASQWCPQAGRYSFEWQGRGMAKGVYLCTLSDGSRRVYGRLLLQ